MTLRISSFFLLAALAFGQESAPAKLYVYRYGQYVGKMLKPSVYCDDSQLARIPSGKYAVVAVKPGKHTLRGEDKQTGIFLNVEPGKAYYARVELVVGVWKGHGRLVSVPPDQGAYEVQRLTPIKASKVQGCE